MKNQNLRSGIQALLLSGVAIFFVACHNNDYTKSSTGSAPANNDTATNSTPGTDTTMNRPTSTDTTKMSTPAKQQTAMSRKKGRVTVGTMKGRETASMKPDENGVYERTDVKPTFPGGQSALDDYVNNHIEYPTAAIDNNSEGTVDVQFVIDENGKVTNAEAVGKKIGNGLDEEAVQVVSSMPKWTPGQVKGKNVKTRIVLPITYKMEE